MPRNFSGAHNMTMIGERVGGVELPVQLDGNVCARDVRRTNEQLKAAPINEKC